MATIRPSNRYSGLVLTDETRDRITLAAILIADEFEILSVADLQKEGLLKVREMGEDLSRSGGDGHLDDKFLVEAIIYTACQAMTAYAEQRGGGEGARFRVFALLRAIRAGYDWLVH